MAVNKLRRTSREHTGIYYNPVKEYEKAGDKSPIERLFEEVVSRARLDLVIYLEYAQKSMRTAGIVGWKIKQHIDDILSDMMSEGFREVYWPVGTGRHPDRLPKFIKYYLEKYQFKKMKFRPKPTPPQLAFINLMGSLNYAKRMQKKDGFIWHAYRQKIEQCISDTMVFNDRRYRLKVKKLLERFDYKKMIFAKEKPQ